MPPLNRNRPETVPTYLNLPRTTRDKLESMIGQDEIKSLTDAVIKATNALEKSLKKPTKRKPTL